MSQAKVGEAGPRCHEGATSDLGVKESSGASSDQKLFEYAWKYYEIHITHRTATFNFLLVGAGLVAAAYQVPNPEKAPAVWVGILFFASVASLSFFMLDVITLGKIKNAKKQMIKALGPRETGHWFAELINHEAQEVDQGVFPLNPKTLRDPIWTTVVEIVLIFLFVTATCEAFRNWWCKGNGCLFCGSEIGKIAVFLPGAILSSICVQIARATSLLPQAGKPGSGPDQE